MFSHNLATQKLFSMYIYKYEASSWTPPLLSSWRKAVEMCACLLCAFKKKKKQQKYSRNKMLICMSLLNMHLAAWARTSRYCAWPGAARALRRTKAPHSINIIITISSSSSTGSHWLLPLSAPLQKTSVRLIVQWDLRAPGRSAGEEFCKHTREINKICTWR